MKDPTGPSSASHLELVVHNPTCLSRPIWVELPWALGAQHGQQLNVAVALNAIKKIFECGGPQPL